MDFLAFCERNNRVELNDKYFTYSYKDARQSFIKKALELEEKWGYDRASLHSLPIKEKGRDGEELATDILWLGFHFSLIPLT